MKIKLALLENDKNYLSRIVTAFNNRFADKLQVYSFTKADEVMYDTIDNSRIDVLLSSPNFDIDFAKLSNNCAFAYFVESVDIDAYNGRRTICKYQKADIIYKEILNIFSELASNISGVTISEEDSARVVTFLSASGGTGSSTVAAAYAKALALRGQKPLYLNFELFGDSTLYFSGKGQYNFSDVIYAIKSKKANMVMKLESCVKQDESGVYFYDPCNNSLDALELNSEEIGSLIRTIKSMNTYTHIIIDTEISLDEKMTEIFKFSSDIVFVCDGSEVSNNKFEKLYKTLSIVEKQKGIHLLSLLRIIYNKFSNKTSHELSIDGLNVLGGVPRYEHASTAQIIEQIMQMNIFDKLM